MKHLDYHDFLFINNVVYMVNEEKNFDTMRRRLLLLIREHIPCNVATFFLADVTKKHITASPIGIGGVTDEKLQAYILNGEKVDYMKVFMLTGGNQVIRHSDLFESNTLSAKQRAVFGLTRPKYAVTLFMFYKGEFMGIITLYRSDDDTDFTDRELQILEMLSRHVALKIYHKMKNDELQEDYRKLKIIELARKYDLSKREQMVLNRIYMGDNPAQIAEALFISESTVKNHTSSIYKKLNIHGKNQLFRLLK